MAVTAITNTSGSNDVSGETGLSEIRKREKVQILRYARVHIKKFISKSRRKNWFSTKDAIYISGIVRKQKQKLSLKPIRKDEDDISKTWFTKTLTASTDVHKR